MDTFYVQQMGTEYGPHNVAELQLMARSGSRLMRAFATVYTTFFRGVPELLTLYIIAFGLPIALKHVL